MSLDLVAELDALVDAFTRERVEYALCGGLALGLHGHPRATMDIDFLIRPESRSSIATPARSSATMKRIAGRPQDLADLAALEGTDDTEA